MKALKYTEEQFREAVKTSDSIREVLGKLGLKEAGGNYQTAKSFMLQHKIDSSHFTRKKNARDALPKRERKSWSQILIKSNMGLNPGQKERLFVEELIPSVCQSCNVGTVWNDEPLRLHIDHINGDNFDNRLENLRVLCPNCHSQTDTYCGRNKKEIVTKIKTTQIKTAPIKTEKFCLDCDCQIDPNATRCRSCAGKLRPSKIVWPSDEELSQLYSTESLESIGRQLKVSGNAVKKRLKSKGLWKKN